MATDEAPAEESVVIDHRDLRSALEFAVAIAAETAKRKPPMESPKELRAYFGTGRIPNDALGRIRRAVEADDRYRQRLAAGAIPELVDDVGRLWLGRPAGWQDQIAKALDAAESAGAAEDAQRALKRSERRRRAAEQATARAVADLVRLEAAADAAREENDQLRASLQEAAAHAAQLREELIAARNAARHAGDRERAATDKLDEVRRELAARGSAAGAPEAGERVAREPVPGEPDDAGSAGASGRDGALLDALRADVERAASTVEQVAADLRRTLGEVDDRPAGAGGDPGATAGEKALGAAARPRGRAANGREPLALPGGVRASSTAAAEFLLRSGAPVLVDGYNVAMLAWPGRDLCEQRESLIEAVENIARRFGATTTIVFDGSAVVGGFSPRRRLTRVVYSAEGVTADDVIRQEVERLGTAPVVVVTNDAEIVRDVRAAGGNVISSTTLLALL
jgi:hypothetical protein